MVDFFLKNFDSLRDFVNDGIDHGKYPSFSEFLDESLFFYNKPYIHKFRLEDFYINFESTSFRFIKVACKSPDQPNFNAVFKPSTAPWRYKRLIEADQSGILSDYINTLIDTNAIKIADLGY